MILLLEVDRALGNRESERTVQSELLAGVLVGVPCNGDRTRAIVAQALVLTVDLNAALKTDEVDIEVDLRFDLGDASLKFTIDATVPDQRQFNGGHSGSALEHFSTQNQLGLTVPFDGVRCSNGLVASGLEAVTQPVSKFE